jgi:hypothetical protein
MSSLVSDSRTASGMDLFVKTGLVAAHRPASVILPLLGATYGMLVGQQQQQQHLDASIASQLLWHRPDASIASQLLWRRAAGRQAGERSAWGDVCSAWKAVVSAPRDGCFIRKFVNNGVSSPPSACGWVAHVAVGAVDAVDALDALGGTRGSGSHALGLDGARGKPGLCC